MEVRDRHPLALGRIPGAASREKSDTVTEKTKHLGQESGKSSNSWFGGDKSGTHPKGNGASAGDGRTSDTTILGKIVPKWLSGR